MSSLPSLVDFFILFITVLISYTIFMIAYFSKHLNNFFSMPSSHTNWYKIFWEEKKKKKKYLESSKGKLLNWDNSIHSFKYYKQGPTPITLIHVQIFLYILCSIHVSRLEMEPELKVRWDGFIVSYMQWFRLLAPLLSRQWFSSSYFLFFIFLGWYMWLKVFLLYNFF